MTLDWTVLVPLKALPSAKSRLAASLPPHQHVDLVEAIRADTIAAILAATAVARVIIVADQASDFGDLGATTVIQREPGLNAGLAEAAALAAEQWPDSGIASLVGDLPALRPEQLDAALHAAAGNPRSFVPDASGLGTTLLAARPGVALNPSYGAGSAARHAEFSVELPAEAGLRADVDTAEDLDICRAIGVGERTAAVLASFATQP